LQQQRCYNLTLDTFLSNPAAVQVVSQKLEAII
jgi:hypothetical protein